MPVKNMDKETGKSTVEDQEPESTCFQKITSCRWVLAFMLFLLRMCQTALRQSIGMALVCMADRPGPNIVFHTDSEYQRNSSSITSYNSSSSYGDIGYTLSVDAVGRNTTNSTQGNQQCSREFVWDATFEGIVLSSYYYGYLLTPLLSGYLVRCVGAKSLVATAIGLGAIVNLVTPVLTRQHQYLFVALRVVAGTTNGMIDPAVQALWAVWAPRPEVAYLTAVDYAGVSIGGIFTFLISGLLCQIPIDNGWPLVFYFYGGLTLVWVFTWLTLIYNNPSDHPRITEGELKYILKETHRGTHAYKSKTHPPWGKMLCSAPVWAVIVASTTFMWVYSWILSYLPTYMENVLYFNIAENAVYSSLPFLGKFICGLFCGYLADMLLKTKMTVEWNRKMFQMLGCVGCAFCLMWTGYLDHSSRFRAVGLLVLAVTMQSVTTVAFRINALDIAPIYSSFILGISSTISVAFSLTAPLVTSAIIPDNSIEQWRIMFSLNAAICIFGGLVFLVLGKAELQSWAHGDVHLNSNGTLSNRDPDNDMSHETLRSTQDCQYANIEIDALSPDFPNTILLPPSPGHSTVSMEMVPRESRSRSVGMIAFSVSPNDAYIRRFSETIDPNHLSPIAHNMAAGVMLDLDTAAAAQWSSSYSLTG